MELIDRQSMIDKFEPWLKVKGYSEGERNMLKAVLYELAVMPSAQPELDSEALIRTIEMGITATNSNDIYSLGMRNGMRWCKSLIDGVEPKFENYVTSVDDWKELPSAQPERKTGYWVSQKGGGYCCSECGRYALDEVDGSFIHVAFKSNFCPYCGADMRTKETDYDYERAVEQLEYDMLYEPTFNQDDGSM